MKTNKRILSEVIANLCKEVLKEEEKSFGLGKTYLSSSTLDRLSDEVLIQLSNTFNLVFDDDAVNEELFNLIKDTLVENYH